MDPERLGREMGRGAGARRGKVQTDRTGLCLSCEFLEVRDRQGRVHHQNHRERGKLGDRRKVFDRSRDRF